MKRFYLLILTVCTSVAVFSQQLPSQIQAKRGVFTERLFLSDRWIDRIATSVPSIYDSSNNVLPTTKAMADLFRLHSIQSAPISADGDYIHNWNHKNLHIDSINRLQFEEFETDSTFPLFTPKIHNTFRMQPGLLADSAINISSVMRNIDNSLDSMTGVLGVYPGGATLYQTDALGACVLGIGASSIFLSVYAYNGDWPLYSGVAISPDGLSLSSLNGNISIGGLRTIDDTNNSRLLAIENNTNRLVMLNTSSASNSRVYEESTYTPDFTALNNVASVSGGITAVMRIGNIVHVSGLITVKPDNASGTNTSLEISLPWFSTLGNKYTCTGTGFNSDYQMGAQIIGDPANNKALLKFASLTTNPVDFSFSFQYIINTQGE